MILGKTYLKEALDGKKTNIYLLDALLKTAKKYIAKNDFLVTGDYFNSIKNYLLVLYYFPDENNDWGLKYGWNHEGMQKQKYFKTFKEACNCFVENLNKYATKIPKVPCVPGVPEKDRYKKVCDYRDSLKPEIIKTFKENLKNVKTGKLPLEKETESLLKSSEPTKTSFTAQIQRGRGFSYYGT